jgi:hypothetical protein
MMVKLDKLFTDTIVLDVQQLTYIPDFAQATAPQPWLEALTGLELGEAAKQVFVTLLELRCLNCQEPMRCKLLDEIAPVLAQVLIALEQHYLHQSILETPRDQQIAQLVLEIKSLIALIYSDIAKRTGQQLETRPFSLFDFRLKHRLRQLHKYATMQALLALCDLMHSVHLIYLELPKSFWTLTYTLFHLAQTHHARHDKVEPGYAAHHKVICIDYAFKQLLLLYILNSHKLSQFESNQLKLCIPYWLDLVKLEPQPNKHSKYELNLFKSHAPKPFIEQKYYASESLFLNIIALKNYLAESIGNNKICRSETERENLSSVLKFHSLSILDENNIRKNTRYTEEGEIQLLLGISSAHFFLSKAKHFKESLELNDVLTQDARNYLEPEHKFSDYERQSLNQSYSLQFNTEISTIYSASLVNRSSGGFCLQWTAPLSTHLRTGRFILSREHKDAPWSSGIIRWIKSLDHQMVQFGVELFSHHILCPAAVKMVSTQQVHVYHPAIIVIGLDNQYTIILQSSQIFSENQNLILRLGQEELRIFLKTGSILTSNCARFDFDVLETSKRTTLQQCIEQRAYRTNTQDLWESLK